MRRSTDRILVSHAGTLPTPSALEALYRDFPATADEIRKTLPASVAEVVDRQAEIGIDVVNDGEFVERGGFGGYINYRLGGFEFGEPRRGSMLTGAIPGSARRKDRAEFPGYWAAGRGYGYTTEAMAAIITRQTVAVTGPIAYIGMDILQEDLANLKSAAARHDVECVMPSTLPSLGANVRDDYYPNAEARQIAFADAIHEEYKAITAAGVVLQLDNPGIANSAQEYDSIEEYRRAMAPQIELINYALTGIEPSMVRMHTCWGGNHGPHKNDVPLRELIETIFTVDVGCYNIEQANPRHEHEWHVFEDVKLPDGKIFMPGVVGHATDIIEHPGLVADRLCAYASVLGRENVMGGTDCGISARVGHPEICWAKLASLVEGARIASERLWRS